MLNHEASKERGPVAERVQPGQSGGWHQVGPNLFVAGAPVLDELADAPFAGDPLPRRTTRPILPTSLQGR